MDGNEKPSKLTQRRQLRRNSTPAEIALWNMIRDKKLDGRKFRRQHSIGFYIADFCCVAEMLVIELDGQVHNEPGAQEYDFHRDEFIKSQGFTVLRFENRTVFELPDAVLHAIRAHFDENLARQQGLR